MSGLDSQHPACSRCGISFHPELTRCPLCGALRERERVRRSRLFFLANTIAVSFVASVVLVRSLSGGEVVAGMSAEDCSIAKDLVVQTRIAANNLEQSVEAASELEAAAQAWAEIASRYTPGKFSWSSSGREHNWLERLAQSSEALASGDEVLTEKDQDPVQYVTELTRLLPRYCS